VIDPSSPLHAFLSVAAESVRPQQPLHTPPFNRWLRRDGADWAVFHRDGDDYRVRFVDIADFRISRAGQLLEVARVPGASADEVEHLLINQVYPLALSRQFKFLLHASAVAFADGDAVAFAAVSGSGKSTLAASFAAHGCSFLSDDGLQIEFREEGCQALPSHPSLRVWSDSRSRVRAPDTQQADQVVGERKSRISERDGFVYCREPRWLRRVYFLEDSGSDGVVIAPVRGQEVLARLLTHSFLLDVEERDMLAWHFSSLARLSRYDICFTLDYPREYSQLAAVRAAILEHARVG
jgi:hypothetical protein